MFWYLIIALAVYFWRTRLPAKGKVPSPFAEVIIALFWLPLAIIKAVQFLEQAWPPAGRGAP